MSLASDFYETGKSIVKAQQRKSNCSDKYRFVDRRNNASTVAIILAGYKQPLWPFVFARLKRGLPSDIDVCVMSAGRDDPALDEICAANGWSYLATRTNDVSLVQNVAIVLHPAADLIVKIDEDMFVTEKTIIDTIDYHGEVKRSGIANPAFVAPTINVNGVCYRPLLEKLGLLEEFESRFGVARVACIGVPITDDPEAARWMWEKTAPLEVTVEKLPRTSRIDFMAPVQFSIGLIVIERTFWEQIGLHPVKRHMLALKKSTLGADEEYLCRMAMFHSRPIVVCPHALAGHFSFGRQYAGMLSLLSSHPEYFRP